MASMKPLILFSVVLLLAIIVNGDEILAGDSRSNQFTSCDHYCSLKENPKNDNNLVSRCCKVAGYSFGVCGTNRRAVCASEATHTVPVAKNNRNRCADLQNAISDFSIKIKKTLKTFKK